MQSDVDKKPKIFLMGEEVPWDEAPEADAADLRDYFKPVKLSGRAIDAASTIVPPQFWSKTGIYTFLQHRADHVFSKMASGQREAKLGQLKYLFEFDDEGPVLKTVQFAP